jgi:3-oxoacyl-[acyl-carrier-protein] synthase II
MRNVVVTGMGIVSSLGFDVDMFFTRMCAGDVAIDPAPWVGADGSHFAWWSSVRNFVPEKWMSPVVEAGTDLYAQYTLAAAEQCVRDAGALLDPIRTAVVHGTTMGGTRALMQAQHGLERTGPDGIDRKTLIKIWPNMAAAQIAMRWGLHGPQYAICTACASSVDAIGMAARLIADGRADAAIAGGTDGGWSGADGRAESDFVPATYYGQTSYGMTTAGPDRSTASIPFDRRRTGIVTGEGSAMLMLERADHAAARGATVLAEIVGYGSLADGFHPSSPEPSGRWEAEAMRQALHDAELPATAVGGLIAHATATPKGDIAEIRAINAVHPGRTDLQVMSVKGHIGHSGAAAGAMGVVVAALAMARGTLPPTAGTADLEPEIEFHAITGGPAAFDADVVQVNAFGFGGQDASLVLRRPGSA